MYALSLVFPVTYSETAMTVCARLVSTREEDYESEASLGCIGSLKL